MQHPYRELLSIIEEEADIIDPDDYPEERTYLMQTKNALNRAHTKIRDEGTNAKLTNREISAVKHALEDVGELYLFAGTSAGFSAVDLSPKDVKEHQSRGEKARTQAAKLGIYLQRR